MKKEKRENKMRKSNFVLQLGKRAKVSHPQKCLVQYEPKTHMRQKFV